MPHLRLIHWNDEECAPRARLLRKLGYEVDAGKFASSSMKEFRENPPSALIIDLSRRPSHGREIGVLIRGSKSTRLIPLVYVEGEPEKIARVQATIPDARYTTYEKIGPVLEDVLSNPVCEVFVPKSLSGPDSPVPLTKKLGLKDGQPVGLINAPSGFERRIPGFEAKRNPKGKVPLTLWFVESRREYESALPKMRQRAEDGGIWVVWPKTTKTSKPDINGNIVREAALAFGLVDFKICAVDEVWSGMRFAVKRR
ncbi:MAG: DUF3052 family protein [Acidobacteria bacterium]|nr:DUF3052 family protein [Acidobacteriota bacterium]